MFHLSLPDAAWTADRGIVQCYGYAAYKTIANTAPGEAITLAFCWARLRRASSTLPRTATSRSPFGSATRASPAYDYVFASRNGRRMADGQVPKKQLTRGNETMVALVA
jgi:hypothetical protein